MRGVGSLIGDHISDAEQWENKLVKILLLFAEKKKMNYSIPNFPVLCRSNYRMQIFVNHIYLRTSILFSKTKVILKKKNQYTFLIFSVQLLKQKEIKV